MLEVKDEQAKLISTNKNNIPETRENRFDEEVVPKNRRVKRSSSFE